MADLKEMVIKAGTAAHAGTSFSPDVRGRQEWESFNSTLENLTDRINALPISDEAKAEEASHIAAVLLRKNLQILSIRSRCMSAMITGPSNFPVRRQEKQNNRYDTALSAYLDFIRTYPNRVMRKHGLLMNGIRINDDGAAEKTAAQIQAIEAENARMKEINAMFKKHGSNLFTNIELTAGEKAAITKNLSFHSKPFPAYKFTNNSSNKRRLQDKLAEITRREERFKAKGNEEIIEGDIRIVLNITENRTQMFFPGNPPSNTRDTLKRNGFRWSPTNSCWQAYLNPNSEAFAKAFQTLQAPKESQERQEDDAGGSVTAPCTLATAC